MNRTEKFMLNSISAALLQIVVFIAGMITPRIMLLSYGSEINGLVSSISQFISYFHLVEAGLSAATIYALYSPLANKDYKRINSVVTASKNFYMQAGLIFTGLTVVLSLGYPLIVKTNLLSMLEVGILVLVLGFSGAFEFFTLAKYRTILTADQRHYIVSLTTMLVTIVKTILIFVMAKLGVGIVMLKFVILFTVFIRSFVLSVYTKKHYKYLDFNATPDNSALNKRWDALYQQILGSVQHGAPTVIATFFTNLKVVSIYSIYGMVLSGINGVLSIFISGLSASFGEVIAKKDEGLLKKTYSEFEYLYYMIITIVYSICFVTIMPFIKIYTADVSDVNYVVPLYGFLFTLNGLLYNLKTPQGMLVISAGMYKETRWRSTIQAAIIVVLGVVLAPFWKLYGILIALCASNLYRVIDLLFFVPRNITKLSPWQSFRRILRLCLNACIVWLCFAKVQVDISSYIQWFIFAIIAGLVSLGITILTNWLFEKNLFLAAVRRIIGIGVKRFGKTSGHR